LKSKQIAYSELALSPPVITFAFHVVFLFPW